MKSSLISVIMPIYNGERYLEKSISRILNNTYSNLELILVNDGSTDSSLQICVSFQAKDKRVKVIDQDNTGLCAARNRGIREATGTYLCFADQDDDVSKDAYQSLLNGIRANDADFAIAGKRMLLIDSCGQVKNREIHNYNYKLLDDKSQINELILNVKRDMAILHIWNCIYKVNIIKRHGLKFDETFRSGQEDTLFNIIYCLHCNKVIFVNKIVYTYFRRYGQSISLSDSANSYEDYIHFMRKMHSWVNDSNSNLSGSDIYFYGLRYGYHIYRSNSKNKTIREKNNLWYLLYDELVRITGNDYPKKYCKNNLYYRYIYLINLFSRKHIPIIPLLIL